MTVGLDGSASSGQVALVTGASRGLGATLARFLAAEGYDLVVCARDRAALQRTAEGMRTFPGRVSPVGADVSRAPDRARLVDAVRAFGALDLLVNNASELGVSPLVPLSKFPVDRLPRLFGVNVAAPLALLQELLPVFRTSGALVVNISSDAAVAGYPGWGAYGATKAALDLASLTLAHELRDRHVYVVSVDPGDMRTAMHQAAYPGEDISDRPLPEVTLPFWAWLLGQDPRQITGTRFQAQAERWEVPA